MKLVVGLGNPGSKYARTPHNVGFEVVDLLAARERASFRIERRFDAETTEITVGGERLTLMKPLTYMNLSGNSVGEFCRRNGTEPGDILVISDDIHLALGQIRIRPNGSHGGHNGLLSIINSLGSLDFPRLRVGVKPEGAVLNDWVEFVLSKLTPREREELERTEQEAADAVMGILERGLERTMNLYNRKKSPPPEK